MNRRTILIIWLLLCAAYFLVDANWQTTGIAAVMVAKALPEILLLVALLLNRKSLDHRKVVVPVAAALVLSIIGDTAGELKIGNMKDYAFMAQIAFFLAAQICYCISMGRHVPKPGSREAEALKANRGKIVAKGLALLAMFAYLVWVANRIFSAIDSPIFIAACIFYVAAIGCNGLLSVLQTRHGQWTFIAGAVMFIASDSILAMDAFVAPVPFRYPAVMITYFLAQMLLNINLAPAPAKK